MNTIVRFLLGNREGDKLSTSPLYLDEDELYLTVGQDMDINSLESEAGIIATLIHHPEFAFFSEHLHPKDFTKVDNQCVYIAIQELARKGINNIDAYNITETLASSEETRKYSEDLSVGRIQEMIDMSDVIARHTAEEYKMLVDNVLDAALRRSMIQALNDGISLCRKRTSNNLEQQIYNLVDGVSTEYCHTDDFPEYKDVIDQYWEEIRSRQVSGYSGIPFKFKTLNDYVTIERGELVIFGAEAKQGKSMLLLNCAIDLLKQDKSVLYLDSELNTRLFTARIISHLSGIEYRRLVAGSYSEEESRYIEESIEWMKSRKFTHIYIPTFDLQNIYAAIKRVEHTQGLDVLIVDYFKSAGDGDAWDSYAELGRFVDMVKNQIAGDLNIAAIGAAQATCSGKLADSAKIARNASTICMIQDKTPEEIEADGIECGNKKLRVTFNRNGAQMAPGEYIDLRFDGNHILYEEAKQHIPQTPF